MTGSVPPQLDVMQSIAGTHWASGDGPNPTIKAWLRFIAAAYPAMSTYCRSVINLQYFEWCGLAIAYSVAKSGIAPVFGPGETDRFLWALAWLQWGDMVQTPEPGDIVVLNLGGGHHHVTMYEEQTRQGYLACLGGNQTNKVQVMEFSQQNVIGLRRPAAAHHAPPY